MFPLVWWPAVKMVSNDMKLADLQRLECLGVTRRSPQHPFGIAEPPDVDKKGNYGILSENRQYLVLL